MNNTSQSMVSLGEPFPSVAAAVAALTQPQLDRLLSIARRRVERLVRSPQVQRLLGQCEPADFVHDAIMLVLVGEIEPGKGRHTNPRHLAGPRSFFNFLQGIVHSRVHAWLTSFDGQAGHESLEDNLADLPAAASDVIQEVQLNEIKRALSSRLRAFAGCNPALQSTLLLLELEVGPSSQKPSRENMRVMREQGRKVLKDLAAGEDVSSMLLS